MKDKIALIVPGDVEMMPYVRYFTDIFDKHLKKYDIFCWDRNNSGIINNVDKNVFVFSRPSYESNSKIRKFLDYFHFLKFLKKNVLNSNYEFIVIHTVALAIFLFPLIRKKYKNKFIFDIRDFSPLVPFFRKRLERIVEASIFTTISSDGFKHWLPKSEKYVISHNISRSSLDAKNFNFKKETDFGIKVLIIGKLRNFQANIKLIKDCGNKPGVQLIFAGDGPSKNKIEKYVLEHSISNVIFTGRYRKNEEGALVRHSDFLYNVLSVNTLENYLITNRFYLSLVYRKPMIVNYESFQANFVEKYNLGLVINKHSEDIFLSIIEFSKNMDPDKFERGSLKLLQIIEKEILYFEKKIETIFNIEKV